MADGLLTPKAAAERLGVSVPTIYDWLGQSDHGLLIIRGQPVTIRYFQGGPAGQGRIRIEAAEVERILAIMLVVPARRPARRALPPVGRFPGITVPLGRPSP